MTEPPPESGPEPAPGPVPGSGVRAELDYLDALERWIPERRAWLQQYGAAAPPAPSVGAPPMAQPVVHGSPTVGGVLLTLGAVALVAAGIVFTAVAWSFLGPVGRFLLLLGAGAVALVAARLTARRIHGTATALAVIGAGLVSVATAFLLSRGDLDVGQRAAVAALVGVGLLIIGRRLSPLLRAGAMVTAIAGSVFVAAALVTAGESVDDISTEWWSAGAFAVWGLALLAWARVDRTAPWSWLGTAGLVQAVLVGTAAATTDGGPLDLDQDWAALALPVVLLVGALALLLLDRVLRARTWALPVGGVLLTGIAGIAALSGASDASSRAWGSAALVAVALGAVLVGAHVAARPERPTAAIWRPVLRSTAVRAITAVAALTATVFALAFALAVTSVPPEFPVVCRGSFACTPTPAFSTWVDESFPAARGALAAVVAVAFGLVLGAVLRRWRGPGHAGPAVAATLAVVLIWSAIVVDATAIAASDPPVVPTRTIGLAWLVVGLGGIALAAVLRGVPWLPQAPGALAALGVQLLWSTLDTGGWAWAPEAHGVLLAAPLLLAGMTQVLLDPRPVPTLASVGPALSAALLPPTLAVLDDTSDRWASALFGDAADPSTEALVRSVALVVVAAALVVIGARRGWAGVFWPGVAALVLLVAAQLLDAAALLPAWVSLALVGLVLVLAGARWEQVRLRGRRTRQWAARLH